VDNSQIASPLRQTAGHKSQEKHGCGTNRPQL
jgi:hypothetical protein